MAFERNKIIVRDFFTCQSCGKPVQNSNIQIAHKIHQGTESENFINNWLLSVKGEEWSRARIKQDIINNEKNVCVTCSSRCNDKQNILFNPVKCEELLEEIYRSLIRNGQCNPF